MTIYDQTRKIVEKKFYHSEWQITDLLKARNDGLLTDEGEAWRYRYSHMDGTGGKYDMLFRREPEAPVDVPAVIAAIERAAYERGVRDTLAAADKEAKGKVHIGGQAFRTVKLDDLAPAAFALLQQEGR